ncbi:MAG: glycosyltransferase [Acidobacteria bacterium]|nr:glycosyltransferase [Acidobacteriota bacterium]
MKSLSVVIPSYNSAATLGACLRALTRELDLSRDEIIVVDSSSEAIPNGLILQFPVVCWKQHCKRLFPGAARNIGFQLAQKDWVAFLDSDIVVSNGWRNAISLLEEDQVATGGPIEPAHPSTSWGLARYWIEFGQFSERNLPRQSWNTPSCNMIWLHSAFEETGGFPEEFPSADDLLFNFRNMKLRHRQFVLLRELKVFHPADYDMLSTQQHLRSLGYWSARARLQGVPPRVAQSTLSVPLIYLYRSCQAWRRCLRSAAVGQIRSLVVPMEKGVAWWCDGFRKALHENRHLNSIDWLGNS